MLSLLFILGIPLGFLVWHRFDNEARLAEIAARGPGEIVVFHGVEDEIIPVSMSRKLASGQKNMLRLIEVPEAHHNDIQGWSGEKIAGAMADIGR